MPEGDFIQIRRLAVKLLAKQVDEAIEDWEAKSNITSDSYERLFHILNKQHEKIFTSYRFRVLF